MNGFHVHDVECIGTFVRIQLSRSLYDASRVVCAVSSWLKGLRRLQPRTRGPEAINGQIVKNPEECKGMNHWEFWAVYSFYIQKRSAHFWAANRHAKKFDALNKWRRSVLRVFWGFLFWMSTVFSMDTGGTIASNWS